MEGHMQLNLYEINTFYVKYLSQYQSHIFSVENEKRGRKYVGIILHINGYDYFAPLSSYKEKHKRMTENIDFIKLKDYAVININNMIPVPQGQYKPVNISAVKDEHYRYLLQAENREINKNKKRIVKNAEIVYNHKLRNGNETSLAKRTNDFKILEKMSKDFER